MSRLEENSLTSLKKDGETNVWDGGGLAAGHTAGYQGKCADVKTGKKGLIPLKDYFLVFFHGCLKCPTAALAM